jgi:hypothetical protein
MVQSGKLLCAQKRAKVQTLSRILKLEDELTEWNPEPGWEPWSMIRLEKKASRRPVLTASSSSPTTHEFQIFQLLQTAAFSTQWYCRLQLCTTVRKLPPSRSWGGGWTLDELPRDCAPVLSAGQCLKTVVSYGLSHFTLFVVEVTSLWPGLSFSS